MWKRGSVSNFKMESLQLERLNLVNEISEFIDQSNNKIDGLLKSLEWSRERILSDDNLENPVV